MVSRVMSLVMRGVRSVDGTGPTEVTLRRPFGSFHSRRIFISVNSHVPRSTIGTRAAKPLFASSRASAPICTKCDKSFRSGWIRSWVGSLLGRRLPPTFTILVTNTPVESTMHRQSEKDGSAYTRSPAQVSHPTAGDVESWKERCDMQEGE